MLVAAVSIVFLIFAVSPSVICFFKSACNVTKSSYCASIFPADSKSSKKSALLVVKSVVSTASSSRALNAACREYVYQSLDAMGIAYVPSHTSFMIFPIEMEGKDFLQKMTDLKVGVRAFNFMGKNWCRVSMGKPEDMEYFAQIYEQEFAS